MTHQVVNPAQLAPASGFSHAVVADGGRTIWLAGQTALDASGTVIAPGDVVTQFDQALANLVTALAEAGGRPEQLVAMTIYIVDMDDYRAHSREIGTVWRHRP
jgi:enamine deaminase RidA (YjgF/YER057c/UK114 family)